MESLSSRSSSHCSTSSNCHLHCYSNNYSSTIAVLWWWFAFFHSLFPLYPLKPCGYLIYCICYSVFAENCWRTVWLRTIGKLLSCPILSYLVHNIETSLQWTTTIISMYSITNLHAKTMVYAGSIMESQHTKHQQSKNQSGLISLSLHSNFAQ